MTQPVRTPSPHTKPAAASIAGVVLGGLVVAYGFFSTGHLPSAETVATTLGGSGVILGSVGAFIGSHLGITKAQVAHDAAAAARVLADAAPLVGLAEKTIPGLEARITSVESDVDSKIAAAVAALPKGAETDVVALAEKVRQLLLGQPSVPQPPTAGQAS